MEETDGSENVSDESLSTNEINLESDNDDENENTTFRSLVLVNPFGDPGNSSDDEDMPTLQMLDSDDHEEGNVPDPTAAARDHAYLPGNSQPLYPEYLWEEQQSLSTLRRRSIPRQLELAILELDGVVLFPGQRIPLRLRHAQWRNYLQERMNRTPDDEDTTTQQQQQAVCIGIVTGKTRLATRRNTWMRRAMRRGTNPFAAMLLQGLADMADDGDPLQEEELPRRRRRRRHEEREEELLPPPPMLRERQQQQQEEREEDFMIGRIGTMAIISYTYETTGTAAVDVGDPFGLIREQLIVTAFGASRFRILAPSSDNPTGRPGRNVGDMAGVRIYRCEELPEERLTLPPLPRRPHGLFHTHSEIVRDAESQSYFDRHYQILHHLSKVTPLPYVALRCCWPWRLVGQIRLALDRIQAFEGLRQNLPPLHDMSEESMRKLDPIHFSFWMAANMSLKEEEKLEVLRMQCPVQRLRYIYDKVLEQERTEQLVCCRMCLAQVSRASNIFTVGGAEGTTGAYVNEHGVVHQTVTLRTVDETKMIYTGRAETRDSWFPGYSWTIASCRSCNYHLGWKFRRVHGGATEANNSESQRQQQEDRPNTFWGLSGASITTGSAADLVDDDE